MQNDLEILSEVINTIHNGIVGKEEMISTHTIDAVFKEAQVLAEQQFVTGKKKALKYLNRHIEVSLKLQLVVEMTIKHLNKLVPLSALDFYRLMRCRKIEKNLSSLLDFYRAKTVELQKSAGNEQSSVLNLEE